MNVRRGARVLLVQLLNAETGARGYALTENESFLEPFNQAAASLRGAVDELIALTADSAEQQDRLRQLSSHSLCAPGWMKRA
jgi:CHASE3 domain sensor protein